MAVDCLSVIFGARGVTGLLQCDNERQHIRKSSLFSPSSFTNHVQEKGPFKTKKNSVDWWNVVSVISSRGRSSIAEPGDNNLMLPIGASGET